MPRKSVLERAFELAAAGPASSINEIRTMLQAEDYNDAIAQTSYPTIRKQLRIALRERLLSKSSGAAEAPSRMTGILHLSL